MEGKRSFYLNLSTIRNLFKPNKTLISTTEMKDNLINYWKKQYKFKEPLLKAFSELKREEFVFEGYKGQAYSDVPLPLISGQTISQPTTIMIMTSALEVKKGQKILEVGSGSGYQAALLGKLVGPKGEVITTEIIHELVLFAKLNLQKANIKNVEVIHTDGSQGYNKEAPYDRIIVTAAAPETPKKLLKQLKPNGILIAPVGPLYCQEMLKIKKKKKSLDIENLGDFVFVPLKGEEGY